VYSAVPLAPDDAGDEAAVFFRYRPGSVGLNTIAV